jgi:RND superfamily putative drug exporter
VSAAYAITRLTAAGQAAAAAAAKHGHHRLRELAGGLILAALIAATIAIILRVRKRRSRTASGRRSRAAGPDAAASAESGDGSRPGAPGGPRGLLYKTGLWSARHKVIVIVLWLGLLGAAAAGSHLLGGAYADNFALSSTSAQQGADLLHAHRPSAGGQGGQLVFNVASGSLGAHRSGIEESMTQMRALPDVLGASDPLAAGAVAGSGRTAYATVHFSVNPQSLGPGYLARVNHAVAPARQAGVSVNYGGQLGQAAKLKNKDPRSEEIGIAAALLVLLIGFGSVYGAGLPVLSALAGAFAGLSVLGMLAAASTFPTVSPTLAIMMGLGVGIDYSLFLTTRHRQLVMDGADPAVAAASSLAASGGAVLIAAMTVVIALLGLYASGLTYIGKLGLAAGITVAVAALSALTVVPALLAVAGRSIDRLRIRRPVAEAAAGSGGWQRYAERLGRHPWRFLAAGLAVLAILAVPAFSMQLGHVDAGADPPGSTAKIAYDELSAAFGPGANGPFTVVAQLGKGVTTAATRLMVQQELHTALARTPDVAAVSPVKATGDGALLYATVLPRTGPQTAATDQLMERLQQDTLPSVLYWSESTGYVTGSLAGQLQFRNIVDSRLPYVIAAVIAAAFLLLLFTFRSPVLALKAGLLNLISIGAAYGVVVAVFQWGWGSALLGVSEHVPIESYVPMMIFAIVFGLSMDYEVFLLSRVREAWLRTGDNRLSVAQGLASTARVISCAALIMTSVFAAFLLSANVIVKMLALGLGLSVLIDASVIRLLVVPATMFILGRYNWWTPRWLDRLGGARRLRPGPPPSGTRRPDVAVQPGVVHSSARAER